MGRAVTVVEWVVLPLVVGWAYVKPIRKLYYNMTITLVSVLVALVIGGIEALSIIGDQFKLEGPFWDLIGNLSDNFGTIGYVIIGIFIVSWVGSTIIYNVKKYDDIEVFTSAPDERARDRESTRR